MLLATSEEIPYATTVIVDGYEEGAKLTRISATIYCERDGQKGILVGKHGQMMKKIGTGARVQTRAATLGAESILGALRESTTRLA